LSEKRTRGCGRPRGRPKIGKNRKENEKVRCIRKGGLEIGGEGIYSRKKAKGAESTSAKRNEMKDGLKKKKC